MSHSKSKAEKPLVWFSVGSDCKLKFALKLGLKWKQGVCCFCIAKWSSLKHMFAKFTKQASSLLNMDSIYLLHT